VPHIETGEEWYAHEASGQYTEDQHAIRKGLSRMYRQTCTLS
jgi:hypothetical protein